MGEAIIHLIGSDVVDDAGEAGVASNHHCRIVDGLEKNGHFFSSSAGPYSKINVLEHIARIRERENIRTRLNIRSSAEG